MYLKDEDGDIRKVLCIDNGLVFLSQTTDHTKTGTYLTQKELKDYNYEIHSQEIQ